MKMIKTIKSDNNKEIEALKERKSDLTSAIKIVQPIINDVKKNKDKALKKYAKKFDKISLTKIEISRSKIKAAYKKVDKKIITALKQAAKNIEKYHELQMPKEWMKEISPGVKAGIIVRPLESVGCYVPGGKYPLISSVLMNALPAKVAGVKNIIICTPNPVDEILAAADIAGVSKVFQIGGAQAIAAMAYGTETIPKTNKIVGPGNVFVTAAKKLVYGDVGVDFIAGPSEILIIADKNSDPEFIAADMLSQAEHDEVSASILITPAKEIPGKVNKELKKQLANLSTKRIAGTALKNNGIIILTKDIDESVKISNNIAPEHLEIMIDDENTQKKILKRINNAGAVFVGSYSVEAAGDYASGPNHVLPTGGFAKARAGLSIVDFIKTPTIQKLSKPGLKALEKTITTIAEAEGLIAHSNSAKIRFKK
ncbi:histidinol dehydrogenase [Nanoarchaeota archaeon]